MARIGYGVAMTDISDITGEPVTWTPAVGQLPGPSAGGSPLVKIMQRLEQVPVLDRLAAPMEVLSRPLGCGVLGDQLRGRTAGHALHPALVSVPMGCWTSAILIDLAGGPDQRPSSELLLTAGLVGAVPSVATGLAEWRTTGTEDGRVGALHAVLNGVVTGLFATSLGLRRAGEHRAGVAAALAGGALAGAAGFLGGHLSVARKVGSRSAAFATDEVGPRIERPSGSAQDGRALDGPPTA